MLLTALIHPDLLRALAAAGHGARVLVADGNYPVSTETPPGAEKIYLNLRRGLIGAAEVLEVLVESIPVESALVMEGPDGKPGPLQDRYRRILPPRVPLSGRKRLEFYQEAKSAATAVVITTGEERPFANILLTIGVNRRGDAGAGPPAAAT